MGKSFLLQSDYRQDTITNRSSLMPINGDGLEIIDAIEFYNWTQNGEDRHQYTFKKNSSFPAGMLNTNCIPVGTVEFCLAWYRKMGCGLVRPLNIPETLWMYAGHEVFITDKLRDTGKQWMMKDVNVIKSPKNGVVTSYDSPDHRARFFSEVVDVESEWRAFVLHGNVVGLRKYIGDEWAEKPDRKFVEMVAEIHGWENPAFTLDLIVDKNGKTHILELHDFFACGLYGWDDHLNILRMLIATQKHILKQRRSFT